MRLCTVREASTQEDRPTVESRKEMKDEGYTHTYRERETGGGKEGRNGELLYQSRRPQPDPSCSERG